MNAAGIPTCRACHWTAWAARSRVYPGHEFEQAILALLRHATPEDIMRAHPHPDVRNYLENEWWSPQRIAAHLDVNGHDLVTLLSDGNDGNDPVVTRCRTCQRLSAQRMADVSFGCSCTRNTRAAHPMAPKPSRQLLSESDSDSLSWWDHELNSITDLQTVTTRARRTVHWRCLQCQLRFTEKVALMVQRTECPDCAAREHQRRSEQYEQWRRTPVSDVPLLAEAWADDADPRTVMVVESSSRLRRFRCSKGHHPRITPTSFLELGCPHCRSNTTRKSQKTLAATLPEIASQWHPTRNGTLTPDKVVWDSSRLVWWLADCCEHEWEQSVRNRDKYQRLRCPSCRTLLGSLAATNPSLGAEWSPSNPISAWQVRPHSNPTFVPAWTCRTNTDHVWWAALSSRSTGSGCPDCREVGKSRIELDHYAAAEQLFGTARSGATVRHPAFTARTSWTTDISVELNGRILVIEYDGAHWHRHPDKLLVDERKSVDLLAARHLVVRLREDDLPALPIHHPDYLELRVHSTAPRPAETMKQVQRWAPDAGRDC